MNGDVAACGFSLDPTDYNRQALTNMDGRPKLSFSSCKCVTNPLDLRSSRSSTIYDTSFAPAVLLP